MINLTDKINLTNDRNNLPSSYLKKIDQIGDINYGEYYAYYLHKHLCDYNSYYFNRNISNIFYTKMCNDKQVFLTVDQLIMVIFYVLGVGINPNYINNYTLFIKYEDIIQNSGNIFVPSLLIFIDKINDLLKVNNLFNNQRNTYNRHSINELRYDVISLVKTFNMGIISSERDSLLHKFLNRKMNFGETIKNNDERIKYINEIEEYLSVIKHQAFPNRKISLMDLKIAQSLRNKNHSVVMDFDDLSKTKIIRL